MSALKEMPNKNKDLILPYIHLKPWMAAHHLDHAVGRIEGAYSNRPYVLDIADAQPGDDSKERPVFAELAALRASADGYSAWCAYVGDNDCVIPALQLNDLTQIAAQASRLHDLGRGIAVHLKPHMLGAVVPVIRAIAEHTDGGQDVCFVVDYGRQNAGILLNQMITVALVNQIRKEADEASVAISASSFPGSFTGLTHQEIFEREHFSGVAAHVDPQGLIYSDRGSARAERQAGGGGAPAPRIDFAGPALWNFFRSEPVEKNERPAAYVAQANEAIDHDCWDEDLHVWGTQMIERTARAEDIGLYSPQAATAARINIHLHQQLFHGDPDGLYDTDEDILDDL